MLFRPLAALIIASTASAFLAMDANASAKFTVKNISGDKIRVKVFNGNDRYCSEPLKTKKIEDGDSESIKCRGEGAHQCKIKVIRKGKQYCRSDRDTCHNEVGWFRAVRVQDGGTVVVRHGDSCDIRR